MATKVDEQILALLQGSRNIEFWNTSDTASACFSAQADYDSRLVELVHQFTSNKADDSYRIAFITIHKQREMGFVS